MTYNFTNDIMNIADPYGGIEITDINDTRLNKMLISVTTYGALILPFDIDLSKEENKPDIDKKETTKQEGKIKSAFKKFTNSKFAKNVKSSQAIRTLTTYMKDKRNMDKLGAVWGVVGDKFSGIAITQAIIDGKISSREALDYLFMGFAPALGITGSLYGYGGLMQMKDALFNGKIDVGSFINGFKTALKGVVDIKDMITQDNTKKSANVLEFDLTVSHSETYQSETPDRRVQSGQSLNEYVHNMPITFEVQCALQEGKRYSKAEFRAILEDLRLRKETVSLILGDEIFDDLILTNFSPNHDCGKSGMDYSLSFKKVTRSDITTDKEVTIQKIPTALLEKDINTGSLTASGGGNGKSGVGGTGGSVGGGNNSPNFNQAGEDLKNSVVKYFTTGKTPYNEIYERAKKSLTSKF